MAGLETVLEGGVKAKWWVRRPTGAVPRSRASGRHAQGFRYAGGGMSCGGGSKQPLPAPPPLARIPVLRASAWCTRAPGSRGGGWWVQCSCSGHRTRLAANHSSDGLHIRGDVPACDAVSATETGQAPNRTETPLNSKQARTKPGAASRNDVRETTRARPWTARRSKTSQVVLLRLNALSPLPPTRLDVGGRIAVHRTTGGRSAAGGPDGGSNASHDTSELRHSDGRKGGR